MCTKDGKVFVSVTKLVKLNTYCDLNKTVHSDVTTLLCSSYLQSETASENTSIKTNPLRHTATISSQWGI